MNEVGDLHLATVVVNVTDLDRAAAFWTAALGYQAKEIPSDPAPVHLDLYTSERDRHVERLLELGATEPDDWPYPDDHDFIVLLDPDGNEFCVIQHDQ